MTREKEIYKLIDKEMGIDNYGSLDFQVDVDYGVKYANKTMIEKVCEWLKENIDDYFTTSGGEFEEWFDDMYEDLRQAMEGK